MTNSEEVRCLVSELIPVATGKDGWVVGLMRLNLEDRDMIRCQLEGVGGFLVDPREFIFDRNPAHWSETLKARCELLLSGVPV